ncbi:hypothetical protein [Mucilaginibacter sp. JRF]|nr:hypothetical protein [Mucilaginibacter sp. JRF]
MPVVVSECKLLNILVKVLTAYLMVRSDDRKFKVLPPALHGI